MRKKLLVILSLFIMFLSVNVEAASIKELNIEPVEGVKLTSHIDSYNSAQSIVVTDKYLVVMLTDTNDDNKNALYIYKNNNGSFTYYKTIKNRHYGHGNDMTYNSNTNEIAIINSNKVIILNANNFKEKREISIGNTRSNIAYDDSSDSYYLGLSESGLYNYSSNFKSSNLIISNDKYKGNQGVGIYNNKIYVCNYIFDGTLSRYSSYGRFSLKESLIFKYNKKGKLSRIYHIDSSYKELESIAFWNNTPYLLFQRGGKFKVYKATNLISNNDTEENELVTGELDDNYSMLNSENNFSIKESIESIIKNSNNQVNIIPEETKETTEEIVTNTTPDTTVETNTEQSTKQNENIDTTTIVTPSTTEEVPVVENENTNTNNTFVEETTTANNTGDISTVNVNEQEEKADIDLDNDIEEVVEVPNTKSNNIYFTIIGLLLTVSGIVIEKSLTKKEIYARINNSEGI